MRLREQALVLFSGGQDSATCLGWAMEHFEGVETVGFDYDQRHGVEMTCRERFLEKAPALMHAWSGRLGADHVIDVTGLGALSDTALTREVSIRMDRSGLPSTFVPGRNLLFLTYAAALAYRRGIRHLVLGVCETDFSGYPDCRDDAIKAMQVALNLGMASQFVLHTPLMWVDKGETWGMAYQCGGAGFVDFIVEETHTCYLGDREHRHVWGYGCGECPACRLRAEGWQDYLDRSG